MAVLALSTRLDSLAKGNARLIQLNLDVEAILQPIAYHPEMQLTLAGHHGLMQFTVHLVNKRRILLVQRGQAGGNLVFITLALGAQRSVDVGGREFNGRQHGLHLAAGKGIGSMRMLELDQRTQVTGGQAVYGSTVLAV